VDVLVKSKKETKVPIVSTSGVYLGDVNIPAGTFPTGTVVRVSPFSGGSPVAEDNGDDCDSNNKKSKQQLVSGIFDVSVFYPKGKQYFRKPVEISQVVVVPVSVYHRLIIDSSI